MENEHKTPKSNGHSKTAKAAAEAIKEEGMQTAEAIQAVLEQVGENAEEIFADVQKSVEKTVKKYPVQSVLVCFGVGCLLGALWNSRR